MAEGFAARARHAGSLLGTLFRSTLARAETVGLELEARLDDPGASAARRFSKPEWAMLGLGAATLAGVALFTPGGGLS